LWFIEIQLLCSMDIQWTLIVNDPNLTRLYMLQSMLEQHDIPVQVMDKGNSVYPTLGEGELYVDETCRLKALTLIHANEGDALDQKADHPTAD
jgi:hypothetical protein